MEGVFSWCGTPCDPQQTTTFFAATLCLIELLFIYFSSRETLLGREKKTKNCNPTSHCNNHEKWVKAERLADSRSSGKHILKVQINIPGTWYGLVSLESCFQTNKMSQVYVVYHPVDGTFLSPASAVITGRLHQNLIYLP